MRENPVKRTLQRGGVAVGTMVFEFATTGIARIAAAAGAEFVVFDMEHSGFGVETIRTLMATCGAASIVPIVRVPATQHHLLSRPLDAGAMGVMVPMVQDEEQARLAVAAVRYPPAGRRGAAFGIAHDDYLGGDPRAKIELANREILLVAQIETVSGLERCERIAAVEGVDVLWVGQFDLTNAMGIPGQFTHADYLAALDRVVAACRRQGKAAGFMCRGVEEGRAILDRGFRCLAYWGDLWIYGRALSQGIDGLRAGAA
jgi:2-keto-3-deoxy-L-rhamnonate aldolase RhmA